MRRFFETPCKSESFKKNLGKTWLDLYFNGEKNYNAGGRYTSILNQWVEIEVTQFLADNGTVRKYSFSTIFILSLHHYCQHIFYLRHILYR